MKLETNYNSHIRFINFLNKKICNMNPFQKIFILPLSTEAWSKKRFLILALEMWGNEEVHSFDYSLCSKHALAQTLTQLKSLKNQ